MLDRTLQQSLENISQSFPVLLLTGARQVGKTTLLETAMSDKRTYVTLDDMELRQLAQRDPAQFVEKYHPPVIIDEIQYAPQLFPYIKIYVDKHKENGLFWLTGSQRFHLMKGVQESLAGRIGIVDLLGFSYAEKIGQAHQQRPFLPTAEWVEYAAALKRKSLDVNSLYRQIWEGSYPRLITTPDIDRDLFYRSYIQTYIERDVKDIHNITNNIAFYNFLRAIAARTGQLLNLADVARDVEIDSKTAKAWLSILETSGIVYLLYPYYNNVTKRIIKTPKVYFLDTGLCAYLTAWDTPQSLEAGAMSGAILETYVLSEILKSYWHNGKEAYIYFYRDTNQKEVDFVIEKNGELYPIEVKKTSMPTFNAAKNFSVLQTLEKPLTDGVVLCLKSEATHILDGTLSVPVWWI